MKIIRTHRPFRRGRSAMSLAALIALVVSAGATSPRQAGVPMRAAGSGTVAPIQPIVRVLDGAGEDPIDAIAVAPSDPEIIFVGTNDAGIWKSTDAGATWKACDNGIGARAFGVGVGGLAVDPSNPQTVYAAAGFVYKSIDGGASWNIATRARGNAYIVVVAPSDPQTIYVGAYRNGVLKSVDGGIDWAPAENGIGEGFIDALAVDPTNPSVAFAASDYLYKTIDGGAHWVSTSLPSAPFALAIDPSDPATLYAAGLNAIYKSTDAASTWHVVYKTSALALSIDPTNPPTVYAADYSSGVLKTVDGGITWSNVNSGPLNPETLSLAVSSSLPATVYAGTTDGLFASNNAGAGWSLAGSGLPPAPLNSIAVSASDPGVIYAATTLDRVYATADDGASWTGTAMAPVFQVPFNDPFFEGTVRGVVIHPANPGTAFVATYNGVASTVDGGATWVPLNPLTVMLDPAVTLVFEPDGTLLAGTRWGADLSSDGGADWKDVSKGMTTEVYNPTTDAGPWRSPISAIAVDPADPQIIYAAQGDPVPVYRSTNGGEKWSSASAGFPPTGIVPSLAISKSDPKVLYAATNKGLFKSVNGASGWVRVALPLPDRQTSAVLANPIRGDTVYVGTPSGLLRTVDGGMNWRPVSLPLLDPGINQMVLDPSNPARLLLATNSGGCELISPPPVLTAAGFDGTSRLTISGSAFDEAPEVLINGIDKSARIKTASDGSIVIKGKPAALGLHAGSNTIEIISCSGSVSNQITLEL